MNRREIETKLHLIWILHLFFDVLHLNHQKQNWNWDRRNLQSRDKLSSWKNFAEIFSESTRDRIIYWYSSSPLYVLNLNQQNHIRGFVADFQLINRKQPDLFSWNIGIVDVFLNKIRVVFDDCMYISQINISLLLFLFQRSRLNCEDWFWWYWYNLISRSRFIS